MTEEGDPLDPDAVRALLSRWAVWGEDATHWHLAVDLDWREMRRARQRQLAYLGRYGRQDMLALRLVPVTLLAQMIEAVSDLVRGENALSSMQEDT